MSISTSTILDTLKKYFKDKKVTYGKLACLLGMSESGVKKIFNGQRITLNRIIELCDIVGLSFEDLIKMSANETDRYFVLTHEQESLFVKCLDSFFIFKEIYFNSNTIDHFINGKIYSKRELYKFLRQLESVDLLELHPNDRIKFKVSGRLQFQSNGPWAQKYLKKLNTRIFQTAFKNISNDDYLMEYGHFSISEGKLVQMREEIEEIFHRYKSVSQTELLSKDRTGIPVTWFFNLVPEDLKVEFEQLSWFI